MKVCTITCNNAQNYGALLQAYALAKYMQNLGLSVEVIDYEPEYAKVGKRLWYNPGLNIKECVKLLLRYPQRRRKIQKHRALSAFAQKYIHTTATKYRTIEQLRNQPPTADVYVAGSDQIWNADFCNGRDPAYYLDFGSEDVRKISYAASFATERVPDGWQEQIRKWLRGLDAVSVREDSAVDIATKLGCYADRVCDPAFLLSAEQWSEVANKDIHPDERYLLIYDFECSQALGKVARRIAREKGLRIYSVSPEPLGYAHKNYCTCSPEDFIALISKADCVVSNSLHGSIFAMIFERDFFVVSRGDGLNVRMADLLHRYWLGNRIVTPDTDQATLLSSIDYKVIKPRLASNIEASKAWLKANLREKL